MPRRSVPSATLSAAVRQYFGLQQDELAQLLGVTRGQLAHIEAGRRTLSAPLYDRLLPLARCLPPDPAPGAARPAPAPPPVPPPLPLTERAGLEARLDYCQYHAGRWRRALRPFEGRARAVARWQAALPALLAAHPDPVADAPARQWLLARAAPLSAAAVAEWHRLRLRAEALEAEAAALAACLAPPPPLPPLP